MLQEKLELMISGEHISFADSVFANTLEELRMQTVLLLKRYDITRCISNLICNYHMYSQQ